MTESQPFRPAWISPPGDTIRDVLEERGWTQAELAERLGYSPKHVNDLVQARAAICPEAASRLASVLGGSVAFWLQREAQYRAEIERHSTLEACRQQSAWLAELPLAWMVKQGWVRRFRDKGEQVLECLKYFGVASVTAWQECYRQPQVAFRASSNGTKQAGAVAAWLRQAERAADGIPCRPFDKLAFRTALAEFRALTREPVPDTFVPHLTELCAKAGVAVVFAPAPPGCPVHGVTRWLTPDKALLALSLRYKTNDQLWFSFFHEACHILEHSRKLLSIEGLDGLDPVLEAEADSFARDLLIPPSQARSLSTLRTEADVLAAADRIGVAPGILVGRMQHEKWLPYSHLNALKVRYGWTEEERTRPSDT